MKAIYFEKHGGNEVLQYGDRPTPEPGPGEVRVAVRAAALNRLDLFVRNGIPNVPLPQIPGADASGVVDQLDRLGDRGFDLIRGHRVDVQIGDAVVEPTPVQHIVSAAFALSLSPSTV